MKTTLTIAAVALSLSATVATAGEVPGAHFIEAWDLNGDGHVSLADAREQRANVFAMFDENEDGVLDADEFATFAEHRAADAKEHGEGGGDAARERRKKMGEGMGLAFNDANGDGKVTLEEFVAGTEAWLAIIDRNGDGKVDLSDFGRN